MSKVIYVDIGTHFGQEFKSLFGSEISFYIFCIRRFIGYFLFRRGEKFTLKDLKLIKSRRKIAQKNQKDFIFYFVEANSKIINYCNVYNQADAVFNFAITDYEDIDFTKLFIANNDKLSQGSSIYETKQNINIKDYLLTLGVPAKKFFNLLKRNCEKLNEDYVIILRLNCEGVEDEVIYSAHSLFKEKLVLILGSLKDVKVCKSQSAYNQLINFINKNNLDFVFFSPSTKSWINAHDAILKVHHKIFNKNLI